MQSPIKYFFYAFLSVRKCGSVLSAVVFLQGASRAENPGEFLSPPLLTPSILGEQPTSAPCLQAATSQPCCRCTIQCQCSLRKNPPQLFPGIASTATFGGANPSFSLEYKPFSLDEKTAKTFFISIFFGIHSNFGTVK